MVNGSQKKLFLEWLFAMVYYHNNRKITDTPADREASSGCQTKVRDSLGQGFLLAPSH